MVEALTRIQHGWHHDPFEWLGVHPGRPGYVIRAFMPSAESVELEGIGSDDKRMFLSLLRDGGMKAALTWRNERFGT